MAPQLTKLTEALHEQSSLKVWSLIITFFGDSIVDRGGNVSAGTVQSVLERLGVGAGALRTAFSRLASDGWSTREKLGRRSFYQLTPEGVQPFASAAKRIYSPVERSEQQHSEWLLALHTDKALSKTLPIEHAINLPQGGLLFCSPNASVRDELAAAHYLCVTGSIGDVPKWVQEHLRPADLEQQVASLKKQFEGIANSRTTDPLSSIAARTLLIHQWRRLLLRYPSIPAQLKGDTLEFERDCRAFVHQSRSPVYPSLSIAEDNMNTA